MASPELKLGVSLPMNLECAALQGADSCSRVLFFTRSFQRKATMGPYSSVFVNWTRL